MSPGAQAEQALRASVAQAAPLAAARLESLQLPDGSWFAETDADSLALVDSALPLPAGAALPLKHRLAALWRRRSPEPLPVPAAQSRPSPAFGAALAVHALGRANQPAARCLLASDLRGLSCGETAIALLALSCVGDTEPAASCARPLLHAMRSMQRKDGGWLSPGATGLAMEALCRWGAEPDDQALRRGVGYLRESQHSEGRWHARSGVGYVCGAYLALRGLRAAGVDDREAEVLRGGEWLRSVQNADGGWGENCDASSPPAFVEAPSAATHTAWALLGLMAGGDSTSESVRRGLEFLVRTQLPAGGLFPVAFVAMALAEYLKLKGAA
ncbi:MAG: hypothetical protein HY858_01620 [Candidatus Solibacter usitatus]|nr:hypothetical protein [Candidatus Solibacter usitatus]